MILVVSGIAQSNGEIRGKTFDAQTKKILPGATVFTEYMGKKIGVLTDTGGRFVLKPLTAGTYNVYFTFFGCDTIMIASVQVNPDKATYLEDVFLNPVKGLNPFTKKEYRDKLIDPENTSKISVDVDIYKKLADPANPITAIEFTSPGIKVGDNGEIYFRGSRDKSVVYYIDGVKSRDSDLGIP